MDEEDQPHHFKDKLKPVSIDENGEPVYLLDDYLQHQIDEVDAEIDAVCAVFGECNDVECSYNKGYLKRQALYSCHTCIPESKLDISKAAGVCLACSLHCHNGHDLVELYTKRNFRCDCGNSKFRTGCTLISDKMPVNAANSYNQNFTGLYCTCARPYPDPDDDIEDDMISCSLCEDWFHTRHLGIACPPSNSYEEMICVACVKKHDFLLHYDGLTMTKVDNTEINGGDVNVIDITNDTDNVHTNLNNAVNVEVPENRSETGIAQIESLANEGSEHALVDEHPLGNNAPHATVKTEQEDSTIKNLDANVPKLVLVSQQERNDICDNLDDISRQCEEIDKALDDSTKLVALASASPQDLEENSNEEMDYMITAESADIETIVDQQESVNIDQIAEDEAVDSVEEEEYGEKLEGDPSALENKRALKGIEEESISAAKEHDTADLKVKDDTENIVQDGETKRYCKKPKNKSTLISTKFYESSRWRENLCICTECTKLYTEHSVAYLLDPQDTLQFYKEFGREAYVEGAYGAIKRKIDSLPHTEKIFLVEEMTEFKDKFTDFLNQFADDQRVITIEDVRAFIGNLDQSRKRRKVEMESNYYCR